MRYMLVAYSTEFGSSGVDYRYRAYTYDRKTAELFRTVPKIPFTDSGHSIVFSAQECKPRVRLPPKIGHWGSIEDHIRDHFIAHSKYYRILRK